MSQESPPLIVWLYTFVVLICVVSAIAIALWITGMDVWSFLL
ncbi:MAG: hypothetical protein ACJAUG_000421 [Halioglobus sp.]|jgi:hypothetical protein